MASIDDLPGSGVYDDGQGKGGEHIGIESGPSEIVGKGSSGPSELGGGSSGPSELGGGSSGPSELSRSPEAKEVEAQGFGWSFDPTSD